MLCGSILENTYLSYFLRPPKVESWIKETGNQRKFEYKLSILEKTTNSELKRVGIIPFLNYIHFGIWPWELRNEWEFLSSRSPSPVSCTRQNCGGGGDVLDGEGAPQFLVSVFFWEEPGDMQSEIVFWSNRLEPGMSEKITN